MRLDAAGEAVHRVEAIGVQLATMSRFAEDDSLSEAIAALQDQLADLQVSMVDPRLNGQAHDGVRFEAKLLHEQLREHLEALEALVATEVHALNEMLRAPGDVDYRGRR